jgi:hypothetical protein
MQWLIDRGTMIAISEKKRKGDKGDANAGRCSGKPDRGPQASVRARLYCLSQGAIILLLWHINPVLSSKIGGD